MTADDEARQPQRDAELQAVAARLREARKAAGMVVADLALRFRRIAPPHVRLPSNTKDIERTIRGHEAGDHAVGERYRLLYAEALGKSEAELFGPETVAELPRRESEAPWSEPAAGTVVSITVPTHVKDDDVRRRAALELLAALGMSAATFGSERIRHLIDLALTAEPRDLGDWHLACADHLYAVRTRPPTQVRDDLMVDLLALGRQIYTAGPDGRIEFRRVEAALATLYANVQTRLGDHGSAIRWWRTASTAADATGDLDLRLLVRGAEAGFGLYGQRDPATVFHLTQSARRIAKDQQSVGVVLVEVAQVKALSLLGLHHQAQQRVRRIKDAAPNDPVTSLMPTYWTGDQVHFTESWVYAHAGDEAAADDARGRLLSYGPRLDYQYPANVRLHGALCAVLNGGIDTGARQAVEILAALPPTQHSQMITETGRAVLRAVPLDKWDRPAVRDLRALTTGESGVALS